MSLTTEKAGSQNPPAVAAAPAALAPQHDALSSPNTALADAASGRGNRSLADVAELRRVAKAFVNARLYPPRDPVTGYVLDREQQIDLDCRAFRAIDADISGVSTRGITRFYSRGCELIPWRDVCAITVRQIDDAGNTVGRRTFEVAAS
jgi:hypothetical protein